MFASRLLRSIFSFSKVTNQKYSSFKEVVLKLSDLQTSYSRSQGPGGQNVNKVNSKAEVRLNLNGCDWIESEVIEKIKLHEKNNINQEGEIVITSQMHREQNKNLQQCHKKLKKIIYEHSLVKKERIIEEYQEADHDKEKRISQKKRKGQFKEIRKKPNGKDLW